jgi:2-polyprenyl-3-methyl-5-hydroxy-6-metoxy-1,4-benzoquinol methylase
MDIRQTQTSNGLGIPSEVLAILRCPTCLSTLAEEETGLACRNCEQLFPRVNGIVRFVPAQSYADSFGYEWEKHARTQLDRDGISESEKALRERTGLLPQEIAGKLVLDVGCGMGRFAEVASRWGARVVGVDLSNAAEVAHQNLSSRPSVTFFQADVFSLPFATEAFDYIYSLGVLHHTPDCEKAFKILPGLLKPGGTIAIWLYSGYNKWYRFSDVYRTLTHRLPAPWLHTLCHAAVPLYYVHQGLRRLPIVGRPSSGLLHHVLPVSMHPDPDVRVLDTFDWYSPKYQSKHTYEEVFRWFESCGLDSLRVLEQSISVRGRKPFDRLRIS